MEPAFIKLPTLDNDKHYLFRVDKIHFAEDNGCGSDVWYEFAENDIRWYSVKESVAEIAKKLNSMNSNNKTKVR